MFLAATSPVRGKGDVGEQNSSDNKADRKFIMIFAHLSKLSMILASLQLLMPPPLNIPVWGEIGLRVHFACSQQWVTVFTYFTKMLKDYCQMLVEGQNHHVRSAIAWAEGVCTTRSCAKSKYLTESEGICVSSCFGKIYAGRDVSRITVGLLSNERSVQTNQMCGFVLKMKNHRIFASYHWIKITE